MHCEHPDAFPYEQFIAWFPKFGPPANSVEVITGAGNRALMYLSDHDSVWLRGRRRQYAMCLLAAHVMTLDNKQNSEMENGGDTTVGPVTSSSVGGVSVSMMTPNSSGDGPFEWWLNKTPYGQEFLALLRTRAPFMAFVGSRNPVLPLR